MKSRRDERKTREGLQASFSLVSWTPRRERAAGKVIPMKEVNLSGSSRAGFTAFSGAAEAAPFQNDVFKTTSPPRNA